MNFWLLALLILLGLGVAFLLWCRHWSITVVLLVLGLIYSIGGGFAIEQLSPATYAKLPINGAFLGRSASLCLFVTIGLGAGAIVRAGVSLLRCKGKSSVAASSTEKAPE